ncbi:hypothetical protein Tco_1244991 [Tanacetum coccineum]
MSPRPRLSELHQLDTFYNSLNSNDQDALDSAAGGNFLDKMPRDGLAIIESKSKVRYSRSRPNDSRAITNAPDTSKSAITDHQTTLLSLHLKMILENVNNNVGELVGSPLINNPYVTYAPKGPTSWSTKIRAGPHTNLGTDNQEKDEKQRQNDKTGLGMEKTVKDKAKSSRKSIPVKKSTEKSTGQSQSQPKSTPGPKSKEI